MERNLKVRKLNDGINCKALFVVTSVIGMAELQACRGYGYPWRSPWMDIVVLVISMDIVDIHGYRGYQWIL